MDAVSPKKPEPPTVSAIDSSSPVDASGAFLPPEMPTAMAPQKLAGVMKSERRAQFKPMPTVLRRAYILIGTAAMTLAGGYEMFEVLQVGGVTILEGLVLALFVLLFAWVAFSFMSALAGFAMLLVRGRDPLGMEPHAPLPAISSRNAMLLPTYNEDPYRIMARLRAIFESAGETGYASQFDWFVLSDTTDPAIWVAEEKALLQLRHEASASRIFYRHRPRNTARKSGNIEDWVKRFGAGYDHMIILDADSLMTGDTIVRLVAGMEQHPGVGLIQTLPIVVNARSLFARMQQFAGRLYGPVIASGIAWWHGSEGNYWGHNAIIRVRAFAEDAGLPELSGRKPFGGHILSHDFIEAAFMRRAGWAIHMAPKLAGSFEECPPSLLDFAARDRRWCQGNLQHLAVLPARRLHWVSRLHLMTGIGSYLTAPLWLMFLVLGILISLQAQFVRPEYFPKGFSLFPQWPAQDPVRAAWVFAGTMGLLIVPKLLAYALLLTQGDTRKRFGGGFLVLLGIMVETVLSGLIAPVMMIFQSSAVGEILLGRDAGWQVQRRDDSGVPLREVVREYAVPTLIGVLMAISAYAVSLPLFLWMTPVIVGLLLSAPVAMLSSRLLQAGQRAGLFGTPEQNTPPKVLDRANELALTAPTYGTSPLHELRGDAELREAHLRTLADQPRTRGQIDTDLAIARAKIEDAGGFDEAVSYLSTRETFAVLNSRIALELLARLPDEAPVAD
ncbi:glucans biosynthesis glucosyltransferase MdoH [Tardiphaga sp.]|uniref:glucans biosynthesis glucosyltransferase MdoH n=1 Tax=Tardiphaga sp. TaxID=1926292 RepID=UPI0026296DCC|nr:glucans biosynthesis glucosyltransferase MdoH [Tardiphaga sp.]